MQRLADCVSSILRTRLWLVVALYWALGVLSACAGARSFAVSDDRFQLHGEQFRIISCGIHYFRIPREYWHDRLKRVKSLGCNAIQTYVPWNFHEPVPGQFDFEGERDVETFLRLAEEEGLHVLLRPGPYICAEWDMGGLPAWLLDPAVTGKRLMSRLRKDDPGYLRYVDLFWQELLTRVAPHMVSRGGPVLMVQVENEYGTWNAARVTAYLEHLRGSALKLLGNDTLLYTTDPPWATAWGGLPSMLNTVDFGPGKDVKAEFARQKAANAPGQSPPMNSEYYTGWLVHWGEKMANTTAESVAKTLAEILEYQGNTGSVNLYMAHGGTSFGFWAGSNGFSMDITSYDYDAPISESGATGQPGIGGHSKFKAVRDVIQAATGLVPPPAVPEPKVAAYGPVNMTSSALLYSNLANLHFGTVPIHSESPLTMAEYGMSFGALEYRTTVACTEMRDTWLRVRAFDLAFVHLGGNLLTTTWHGGVPWIRVPAAACPTHFWSDSATLGITVFAYGRDNFFATGTHMALSKGIVGDVTVQSQKGFVTVLKNWVVHAMPLVQPSQCVRWGWWPVIVPTSTLVQETQHLPFDSMHAGVWHSSTSPPRVDKHSVLVDTSQQRTNGDDLRDGLVLGEGLRSRGSGSTAAASLSSDPWNGPVFWRGELIFDQQSNFSDTYLRTDGWTRGMAWINDHNLGRYWTAEGPQRTLYVPGVWLQAGQNTIVMLELVGAPVDKRVVFVDTPDFSAM